MLLVDIQALTNKSYNLKEFQYPVNRKIKEENLRKLTPLLYF